MGLKRRSGTRVVPILLPIALLGMIPATALQKLPFMGTVQDVFDQLFTEIVKHGITAYEKRRMK